MRRRVKMDRLMAHPVREREREGEREKEREGEREKEREGVLKREQGGSVTVSKKQKNPKRVPKQQKLRYTLTS